MTILGFNDVRVKAEMPKWLFKRLKRKVPHVVKCGALEAITITADGHEIALFAGDQLAAHVLCRQIEKLQLEFICEDFKTVTAVSVYNFKAVA